MGRTPCVFCSSVEFACFLFLSAFDGECIVLISALYLTCFLFCFSSLINVLNVIKKYFCERTFVKVM